MPRLLRSYNLLVIAAFLLLFSLYMFSSLRRAAVFASVRRAIILWSVRCCLSLASFVSDRGCTTSIGLFLSDRPIVRQTYRPASRLRSEYWLADTYFYHLDNLITLVLPHQTRRLLPEQCGHQQAE